MSVIPVARGTRKAWRGRGCNPPSVLRRHSTQRPTPRASRGPHCSEALLRRGRPFHRIPPLPPRVAAPRLPGRASPLPRHCGGPCRFCAGAAGFTRAPCGARLPRGGRSFLRPPVWGARRPPAAALRSLVSPTIHKPFWINDCRVVSKAHVTPITPALVKVELAMGARRLAWLGRRPDTAEVRGSNPRGPTKSYS